MADLRCHRCAERLERRPHPKKKPTFLGTAELRPPYSEIGVQVHRQRHGRTAPALGYAAPGPGQPPRGAGWAGLLAAEFHCQGCRLTFSLALERLRPALLAGYKTILVGANGEVVPA
jgi:hypothetical protein